MKSVRSFLILQRAHGYQRPTRFEYLENSVPTAVGRDFGRRAPLSISYFCIDVNRNLISSAFLSAGAAATAVTVISVSSFPSRL